MDNSFPTNPFKSNEMINRATFISQPILHISEQFVRFKIPDKSAIDRSFHGLTHATCQSNKVIGFGIGMMAKFGHQKDFLFIRHLSQNVSICRYNSRSKIQLI